MKITRWYILAGGSATRWEGYLGEKNKCFIEVEGERLLDRTIRLLTDNGMAEKDITVVFSDVYDYKRIKSGVKKWTACLGSKREAFEAVAKKEKGPFGILLGDCYYTDEIIEDAVNRDVDTWKHYYCAIPNRWTQKPWEEGYLHLVPNWEWWLEKMHEFNEQVNDGTINFEKDFQIDRFLRGYAPNLYKPGTLDEHDIFWHDRTDDFDFPCDYDKFIEPVPMFNHLSVILPVYNASKWAPRIMDQLAYQKRQFYPETELILVDDGSTDDTSYMNRDGWLVLHQPNKGVASARNTGLMASTGKYIGFVDADDCVEPDYLHLIYQTMRGQGCDVAVWPWRLNGGQICMPSFDRQVPNLAVWGYTFKRNLIDGVLFDENLNVAEDATWLGKIVPKAKRRYDAQKPIYHYDWDKNPDSLCKRFNRGDLPREKK